MELSRDVLESLRRDYADSGLSRFKIDRKIENVAKNFALDVDIGLPRWSIGRCTCCGMKLEIEALCYSLLLVETGTSNHSNQCKLNDACDSKNITICPMIDVQFPDFKISGMLERQKRIVIHVMKRKLLEFGCCTITKDFLAWKVIDQVKKSDDIEVHVFHDETMKIYKYAVIALPKRTSMLDDRISNGTRIS